MPIATSTRSSRLMRLASSDDCSITLYAAVGGSGSLKGFSRVLVRKPHVGRGYVSLEPDAECLVQPQLCHGIGGHLPLEPDKPPPEQLAESFCACTLTLLFGDGIRDALHHLYEKSARSHSGVEDHDAVVRDLRSNTRPGTLGS